MARFINAGFDNYIDAQRVLGVFTVKSRRIIGLAKNAADRGMLIDITMGRQKKAIVMLDTGHFVIIGRSLPRRVVGNIEAAARMKESIPLDELAGGDDEDEAEAEAVEADAGDDLYGMGVASPPEEAGADASPSPTGELPF